MGDDRTLVQIRERSFLDVLDLTLVVVRQRPITLGVAAAAGALPFAAWNAWLLERPNFSPGLLFYLLPLEVPWATAPLTIVLGGLMFGQAPSARRVVATLARSLVPMVLFQFVLRGIALVVLVLYPLVPARWAFLDEVILLERGRWYQASRRSAALCEQRGGELFGQWLAQLAFGGLFVLAFWAGTGALIKVLSSAELTWEPSWGEVLGVRFQVALWVAIEFFGAARFFAYIDQRIRLEGWEVELRLRNIGQALEDVRRW